MAGTGKKILVAGIAAVLAVGMLGLAIVSSGRAVGSVLAVGSDAGIIAFEMYSAPGPEGILLHLMPEAFSEKRIRDLHYGDEKEDYFAYYDKDGGWVPAEGDIILVSVSPEGNRVLRVVGGSGR